MFLHWSRSVSELSLRSQFGIDAQIWTFKVEGTFNNQKMTTQQSAKSAVKDELLDHSEILFAAYRHLQSKSDTYPLLNYRQMCQFISGIGFIDDKYSLLPFTATYELIKAPEIKKKVTKKTYLKKRISKLAIAYPDQNKKKKEVKEDPKNLMHRFHFIELLAKIAMQKFGETLHPNQCLRRMVAENIRPSSKAMDGAYEAKEIL